MTLRPCLICGALSDRNRCGEHQREQDRARTRQRGTAHQRGYDRQHQELRARLLPTAYGQPCPRCGRLMLEGQALDLDHTDDRTGYLGMTHRRCNAAAGGRAAHH